jgi:hypothetical protein
LSSLPISNTSSSGTVFIAPCNSGNNSQRWRFRKQTNSLLEAWLVSKPVQNTVYPYDRATRDVGHGWFAIVEASYTSTLVQNHSRFDVFTSSAWPSTGSWINNSVDLNATNWMLGNNTNHPAITLARRRARISKSRAAWLKQNYNSTLCRIYGATPLNSSWCTCVDQSTRLWAILTNEDRFKPDALNFSPNVVFNRINDANTALGEYANSGQVIP